MVVDLLDHHLELAGIDSISAHNALPFIYRHSPQGRTRNLTAEGEAGASDAHGGLFLLSLVIVVWAAEGKSECEKIYDW
jgi:hypothetical protein